MRLDIDDKSLHYMLQGKKDYIGGSWINGIANVVGGMSFAITLYSAKISSFWINLFLYIVAFFLIGLGAVQFLKKIGKRSYDYEKLYDDIKKLSVSESQYSLVAILNDFEGDSANKVLLKYFQGGWKTYMFLSYRSAPENDESNVISRVAASLKIEHSHLKVKFIKEIKDQSKYSPDHKSVRMYHNKYYQVFISDFPDILKQPEFTVDGTKYKWMTFEEMWANKQIKTNNADVLREFEKYIFNTRVQCVDKDFFIPEDIYIRLNRVCDLSCSFCLAEKKSQGLSTEQLKTVLEILKSLGISKAKLTGGEPTLRPDFLEIVKYSIELGLDTIVYSNLFISGGTIDRLIKYPISVSTSIHGDEKFHDLITQKGAYRKTYANIEKLVLANVPVTIHMVVMNQNFDLAETVIEDAIRAGVEKVTFQTLIPREKGAELFEKGENIREIREKLKLLYPLREKYRSKIKISFSDLYEKDCYVLETDGAIYLEKGNSGQDKFIRGLV
jgi:organic radical activating enzyme